jgi:acetyl-CoA carboxylase biotin carboxyl carrier protein
MDLKDIKAIYKFIKETDIVEIEIEGADGKVRLRRGCASDDPAFKERRERPGSSEEATKAGGKAEKENIKMMTSPMVGTFFRASSPEASPFAEVGSIVKKGQALCIIEAMKLMNEVESEYNGRVVSILVENGQPVEYGEPLFNIEVG